ncbi:hypothetical protein ACFQX8_22895 [Klenkia terrae]|uniref:hypothetical protein n=1 Tax=Klenkia terrae TaxID=1052259 RepID=UPI003620083D
MSISLRASTVGCVILLPLVRLGGHRTGRLDRDAGDLVHQARKRVVHGSAGGADGGTQLPELVAGHVVAAAGLADGVEQAAVGELGQVAGGGALLQVGVLDVGAALHAQAEECLEQQVGDTVGELV